MKVIQAAVLGILPVLLVGCGGEDPVDIGDGDVGQSGERLSDYADVWVGYAEAATFADESDRIRIELDDEGNGTVTVGEATWETPDPLHFPLIDGSYPSLHPGFAYTVRSANIDGKRLRFRLAFNEVYTEWCSGKTPVIWDAQQFPDEYACMPNSGSGTFEGSREECIFMPADGSPEFVGGCSLLRLCEVRSLACFCSETSCATPEVDEAYVGGFAGVDAALEDDGETLVGTLVGGDEPRQQVRIRLERQ